jgi:hypothetical protein
MKKLILKIGDQVGDFLKDLPKMGRVKRNFYTEKTNLKKWITRRWCTIHKTNVKNLKKECKLVEKS